MWSEHGTVVAEGHSILNDREGIYEFWQQTQNESDDISKYYHDANKTLLPVEPI